MRVEETASALSERIRGSGVPAVHYARSLLRPACSVDSEVIDVSQAIVAIPPPVCPSEVIRSVSSIESSALTPDPGLTELRRLVADHVQHRFEESITFENVLITPGTNMANHLALLSILDPGDTVLLFSPYFFNHLGSVVLAGCKARFSPLDEKCSFRCPKSKSWIDKLSGARVALLADPGNPTGTVLESEFFADLLVKAKKKRCHMILDESYDTFRETSNPVQVSLQNSTITGSFSKSFAMAGWRVGYMVASKDVVESATRAMDALFITTCKVSQMVAVAALKKKPEYLPMIRAKVRSRRIRAKEIIARQPWVNAVYGTDGVLLFARLRREAGSSWCLAKRLARKAGIISLPSELPDKKGGYESIWGVSDQYLRFGTGTLDDAQMETLVSRLTEFEC